MCSLSLTYVVRDSHVAHSTKSPFESDCPRAPTLIYKHKRTLHAHTHIPISRFCSCNMSVGKIKRRKSKSKHTASRCNTLTCYTTPQHTATHRIKRICMVCVCVCACVCVCLCVCVWKKPRLWDYVPFTLEAAHKYSVLQYVAVCCSVCCSVLQSVAVCCTLYSSP